MSDSLHGDPGIRSVLVPSIRAARPSALVVQEWGIAWNLVADVAAVEADVVEAWEIKSNVDSTARLAKQAPLYAAVFDRCTLATAPKHLRRALAILPSFWGVEVYADGEHLRTEREAQRNPDARPEGLLWRVEMVKVARHFALATSARLARMSKRYIAAALADLGHDAITPVVCDLLRARTDWRRDDGYRKGTARALPGVSP